MENSMKKIQLVMITVGLIGMSATAVNAQSQFEGLYGQVGIGFQSVVPSISNTNITSPGGTRYNMGTSVDTSNGFTGTATLGYSFLVTPSFLLGFGGEYSPIAGQSGNYSYTNSQLNPSTISGSYKLKNSYNFFVSPGIVIDKSSVAYAKVGYTGAAIESDGSNTNYTGYSLGLGYKKFISGNIYAFGEGNYMSYGNKTATGSGPWGGGGSFSASSTSSANVYNFLVGVGYKF
jgi:outer membrane immunogenic protein